MYVYIYIYIYIIDLWGGTHPIATAAEKQARGGGRHQETSETGAEQSDEEVGPSKAPMSSKQRDPNPNKTP